ncbi:hypothetical protein [Tsukamurella sp. PLM1]|uniref:hypothetical protein n=1 Tax=Tsukamurella sp. PLM1 TaxID=2929795 RepID=UPI0020656647|nr:hypothetical protein [Tsukamurella sp. PLM1]BDH56874.1 hypothetical protein MTP03_18130 [Tsukamurella sp. PLM1]
MLVAWSSTHPGAEYRVSREQPDGTWKVVGRTRETTLEDGGAPRRAVPAYEVVAVVDGVASAPARSIAAPTAAPVRAPEPPRTTPSGPVPVPGGPTATTGLPGVTGVTVRGALLTFDWPHGVTEAMVVARADGPPHSPPIPRPGRGR